MAIEAVKKKYPIRDENGQSATYPTFASQVFREDGTPLEKDGVLQGMAALDMYPVGSIYLSVSDTSPASLFGGTWEQIEDVFLLGASATYPAGTTGGEAEVTLTVDEMPSHIHGFNGTSNIIVSTGTSTYVVKYTAGENHSSYINATGGDQPHNNMPPYLAVYIWKRVA